MRNQCVFLTQVAQLTIDLAAEAEAAKAQPQIKCSSRRRRKISEPSRLSRKICQVVFLNCP